MSYELILVERKGRVGLVTLNRPKQMNALNPQLMQELGRAMQEFDRVRHRLLGEETDQPAER